MPGSKKKAGKKEKEKAEIRQCPLQWRTSMSVLKATVPWCPPQAELGFKDTFNTDLSKRDKGKVVL